MSYSTNENAYIKMYRKLLNWEWYTDVNATKLFLHCLLKANWKPGRWKGISYGSGEFITSLPSLAKETGLTVQAVRTALSKLKSTGELTDRATDGNHSRGRIITVLKWDLYQGDNRPSNRPANRIATGYQQDSNRIATAEEEYKEYKEYKEPKKRESARSWGEYGHVVLNDEQYQRLVNDYGESATAAAIEKVDRYCQETGKTYNDYELTLRRWGYREDPKKDQWDDEENAELRRQAIEAIEKRFA